MGVKIITAIISISTMFLRWHIAAVFWGWFVAPVFGLVVLTFWQSAGLCMLATLLNVRITWADIEDHSDQEQFVMTGVIFSSYLFLYLVGYIVHLM
jgi:hypothetical protein